MPCALCVSSPLQYLDVIERVKPLILELERLRGPVLIICHQAVARTLLAYFTDVHLDDMVDLPVGKESLRKRGANCLVCCLLN